MTTKKTMKEMAQSWLGLVKPMHQVLYDNRIENDWIHEALGHLDAFIDIIGALSIEDDDQDDEPLNDDEDSSYCHWCDLQESCELCDECEEYHCLACGDANGCYTKEKDIRWELGKGLETN